MIHKPLDGTDNILIGEVMTAFVRPANIKNGLLSIAGAKMWDAAIAATGDDTIRSNVMDIGGSRNVIEQEFRF